MADCNGREVLYLAPLVALCFWIGLYPRPLFDMLEKPVARLVQQLEAPPATGIAMLPQGAHAPASEPGAGLSAPQPRPSQETGTE